MAKSIATGSVRLPKKVVEDLYDASLRFASVLETLEVLMDKQTMRRIKAGQKEFSRHQYVAAKSSAEIRKALAS